MHRAQKKAASSELAEQVEAMDHTLERFSEVKDEKKAAFSEKSCCEHDELQTSVCMAAEEDHKSFGPRGLLHHHDDDVSRAMLKAGAYGAFNHGGGASDSVALLHYP